MEDRLGGVQADTAADLGWRHQSEAVMDIRRALVKARELWCTIVRQLHRLMIAISRISVNHDWRGGTAPYPLVWDQESRAKQRKVDVRGLCKRALGSSSSWWYYWCWCRCLAI